MKIAICSDVHEHLENLQKMLEFCHQHHVEQILCAGDLMSPILARKLAESQIPAILVKGNNDGEVLGLANTLQPPHRFFVENYEGSIAGMRIFMKHTPNGCEQLASSQQYDMVIFGHTHQIVQQTIGQTILLNPGELCGMLTGCASFFVWDTETKQVEKVSL